MSNLNVTELSAQGRDNQRNLLPVMQMPALAVQNLTISGTTAQSAAFQSQTGVIRVRADIACAVLVGADPTALTTSTQMDAGTVEYFAVPVGQSLKIAVIAI